MLKKVWRREAQVRGVVILRSMKSIHGQTASSQIYMYEKSCKSSESSKLSCGPSPANLLCVPVRVTRFVIDDVRLELDLKFVNNAGIALDSLTEVTCEVGFVPRSSRLLTVTSLLKSDKTMQMIPIVGSETVNDAFA